MNDEQRPDTPSTDAPEGPDAPLHRRGIKSYVLRAGRMTAAQTRGLEEVWPRLGLTLEDGRQDLETLFGRRAPVVLEIGFGMGGSLIEQAETHPDTDFIGIEVHAPGVGKLLDEADKRGLTNLRVYREDALLVLEQCLPEGSLDTLQLFFPDPWTKKKHHKRRIVQPAFVELVRTRLKPGGTLHMATDWEAYAEWMAEVMVEAPGYQNTATDETAPYVPRPEFRPLTKFEQRGEKLGHGVWDLIFRRAD
ncbi:MULTISPECIES: tRNA (guanosine(46)-N7)-methyltransferase TrmB [Halomonas]|uniref:tRNA (guanine-N(7)-)-methyltransferase n=1 Tax=Halomonas halophila TaxID=29573 RepID=A0ABQ0U6E0_9GAMM|nr:MULTISPECIES: tRNA (guanosine(46)-N7)-methyltransferase TrmB [Halomonas]MDR5889269.1 tRNA (guanosine(46)-N7)-methyltransferase TrmB [Halomonas salina]WJY07177.1 tRNA (guanosine(46)-N7)-methyltransferase TrmB [Halomonas halophila]GEK73731.1 tRNA (guanine-N(7)-)-methyltransferase [Halomonas halophila]